MTTMMKVILIRPGSTDFDQQGRILGNLDMPLSEQGQSEVASVIEELKNEGIESVFATSSESAQITAKTLAEHLNLKCKSLDALRNVDHGLWQGMQVKEVKRKQPKVYKQWQDRPETVCPPEGEMLIDARDRVAATLAKMLKKQKQGTLALVAPEPLAGLIASFLRQTDVCDSWNTGGNCGSWEAIEVEPSELAATR